MDFNSHETSIPSLDVRLFYVEHAAFSRTIRREFHAHWFWQAEFIVSGLVHLRLPDQTFEVRPGTVLLIPPGIRHAFEYSGANTEYFSFKFSCSGAENITSVVIWRDEYELVALRRYITAMLDNHDASRRLVAVHVQNALKTLLEIELVYGTELPEKSVSDLVRDTLRSSFGSFPSAEDVAGMLGFSRPHLSQRIKDESGMSLKPFMDAERIRIAQRLLCLSDLSISEIGFQLDFIDPFGFSKFFKRVTNMSPSNYRQQCSTYESQHSEPSAAPGHTAALPGTLLRP